MKVRLLGFVLLSACSSTRQTERVPIPPGSTVRAAADSLAAHHVIRSTLWFRLRARWAHADRGIKAGVYRFARGTPAGSLLHALTTGDAVRFRITMPVGGTVFDLARGVQDRLGIPRDSLLAATRDTGLLRRFGIAGPSVEGWLQPESFDFGGFDTPREVLSRFLAARAVAWDTAWDTRGRTAGLDRQAIVVLASIVEAEAKDPAERPVIAAVYRNRLRLNMPLQADPTIQYALLLGTGERKGRLFDADYQIDSPWNTYLHTGLPPGPVGNPSRESIAAVVDPAPVPYLYFVAGPDGTSRFATTYEGHRRNIQQLRGPR